MGLQGSKHLYLYSATRLVDILQEIVAMQPRAVVIDSIQTVYLDDVSGSAGSVSQVNTPPLSSEGSRNNAHRALRYRQFNKHLIVCFL